MAEQTPTRDEEIKAIRKEYPVAFPIIMALLAVIILLIAGMALYASHDAWGYGINVFTSVVSTVATVLILDRLAERRADRKAEEALKRQLVDDSASVSNEIAKNGVHQLNRKEWLVGEAGLLRGADLNGANLQGAYLVEANLRNSKLIAAKLQDANLLMVKLHDANLLGANLQNARLESASLQRANLEDAILIDANLKQANLKDAKLRKADLSEADLAFSNLENANLSNANLCGADLSDANLQGAIIVTELWGRTEFDDSTILPDSNNWSPETDMKKFTDPSRLDFYPSFSWKDGKWLH